MAITLTEQRQAFEDPFLRVRVGSAMAEAAHAVLIEVSTTPNHTNRVILAKQILYSQSGNVVDAFMRDLIGGSAGLASLVALIGTNGVGGVSDNAVRTNVNLVFDAFANGS